MEIRSTDEARENVVMFTKRLLNLLKDKKAIDEDIKLLKAEFKEEGVPVAVVTAVINRIKSQKKKSDSEKFEEEVIREWLEANTEVDNEIGALIAK